MGCLVYFLSGLHAGLYRFMELFNRKDQTTENEDGKFDRQISQMDADGPLNLRSHI